MERLLDMYVAGEVQVMDIWNQTGRTLTRESELPVMTEINEKKI